MRLQTRGWPSNVNSSRFGKYLTGCGGAIEERVRRVVESKRALFEGLLVDGADRITFDETGRAGFVEQIRGLLGDEEEAAS